MIISKVEFIFEINNSGITKHFCNELEIKISTLREENDFLKKDILSVNEKLKSFFNLNKELENEKKFILDSHNDIKESFILKLKSQEENYSKLLETKIKELDQIQKEHTILSEYYKVEKEQNIHLRSKLDILFDDLKNKNSYISSLEKNLDIKKSVNDVIIELEENTF